MRLPSHLWPIIVSVWKNYRDGNGEEPEKKKVQRQTQSGIHLKRRSQGLALLLSLWNAHKKRSIMTALQKTQQAAQILRYRYLHSTNGQKQLTPIVESGKTERSWEGQSCRRTSSLNFSGTPRSLKHCRQLKFSIYILRKFVHLKIVRASFFLICVNSLYILYKSIFESFNKCFLWFCAFQIYHLNAILRRREMLVLLKTNRQHTPTDMRHPTHIQ
jgi:hypothetical protein